MTGDTIARVRRHTGYLKVSACLIWIFCKNAAETRERTAMIVEYIRYQLKQHTPEELIAAYRKAQESLKAAPECHGFELAHCVEDPSSLTLRILWTSTEDHLQGFRKGSHFLPFLAAIRPFVGEIAEMQHYAVTDLDWQR